MSFSGKDEEVEEIFEDEEKKFDLNSLKVNQDNQSTAQDNKNLVKEKGVLKMNQIIETEPSSKTKGASYNKEGNLLKSQPIGNNIMKRMNLFEANQTNRNTEKFKLYTTRKFTEEKNKHHKNSDDSIVNNLNNNFEKINSNTVTNFQSEWSNSNKTNELTCEKFSKDIKDDYKEIKNEDNENNSKIIDENTKNFLDKDNFKNDDIKDGNGRIRSPKISSCDENQVGKSEKDQQTNNSSLKDKYSLMMNNIEKIVILPSFNKNSKIQDEIVTTRHPNTALPEENYPINSSNIKEANDNNKYDKNNIIFGDYKILKEEPKNKSIGVISTNDKIKDVNDITNENIQLNIKIISFPDLSASINNEIPSNPIQSSIRFDDIDRNTNVSAYPNLSISPVPIIDKNSNIANFVIPPVPHINNTQNSKLTSMTNQNNPISNNMKVQASPVPTFNNSIPNPSEISKIPIPPAPLINKYSTVNSNIPGPPVPLINKNPIVNSNIPIPPVHLINNHLIVNSNIPIPPINLINNNSVNNNSAVNSNIPFPPVLMINNYSTGNTNVNVPIPPVPLINSFNNISTVNSNIHIPPVPLINNYSKVNNNIHIPPVPLINNNLTVNSKIPIPPVPLIHNNLGILSIPIVPHSPILTVINEDNNKNSVNTQIPNNIPLPAVPNTPMISSIPAVPNTPMIPSIPAVPNTPMIPSIPTVPNTPMIPSIPFVPNTTMISSIPMTHQITNNTSNIPQVPVIPKVPQLQQNLNTNSITSIPQIPGIPNIPAINQTKNNITNIPSVIPGVPSFNNNITQTGVPSNLPSIPGIPGINKIPNTQLPQVPGFPNPPVIPGNFMPPGSIPIPNMMNSIPRGPQIKAKPKVRTVQQMKPLYWIVIDQKKLPDTIWLKLDDSQFSINAIKFEDEFSQKKRETVVDKKDTNKQATVTVSKPSVLLPSRQQNINIVLSKLRLTPIAIVEALISYDQKILTSQSCDMLLSIIPTSAEINQVDSFDGDPMTLADSDQFVLLMKTAPGYDLRIKAILFQRTYKEDREEILNRIKNFIKAFEFISSNKKFHRWLEIVLAYGNYLNGSSNRGGAYGYRLDILSKIAELKSNDNKKNLLMYIIEYIGDVLKEPELLTLNKELQIFSNLSFSTITDLFKDFNLKYKILTNLLQILQKDSENVEDDDKSAEFLESFLSDVEDSVKSIEAGIKNIEDEYTILIKKFGDTPKEMPMETLIEILNKFGKDMTTCLVAYMRTKELKEKMEKRKQIK